MKFWQLIHKREEIMVQKAKKNKKELNKSFDFVLFIIVLILICMRNNNGIISKFTIFTIHNRK